MRPDDPFAPSDRHATVLPGFPELIAQAPAGPVPGVFMPAITASPLFQATPPAATPEPPPPPARTRRRGPSPRLQALRNGVIINMGNHGVDLVRQVDQGRITRPQAEARFNARTRAEALNDADRGKLLPKFMAALEMAEQRRRNRPSSQTTPAVSRVPFQRAVPNRRTISPSPVQPSLAATGAEVPEATDALSGPPLRGLPSRAEDVARLQNTSAAVRDRQGNFIRGKPVSEAIDLSAWVDAGVITTGADVGFVNPDGSVQQINTDTQVALFDAESGRMLVFNRVVEPDRFERANILPLARNLRTGEVSPALPGFVQAAIDGATLPGDVAAGRVDPRSDEGIQRSADLAGLATTGTVVSRLRVPRARHTPDANTESLSTKRAKTLAENKAKSKLQEEANDNRLRKSRFFKKSATQVTAVVDVGAKGSVTVRLDHVAVTRNGRIVMFESKSSKTAPLTKNQKLAFPEIERSGARIVGKKSEQLGNAERLPPGRVRIIRPREE